MSPRSRRSFSAAERLPRPRLALLIIGLVVWGLVPPAAFGAAAVPDHMQPGMRGALKKAIADSKGFKNRFDAEVWLVDMAHRLAPRVPSVQRRLNLLRDVHGAATEAGLSPQLVLAVIQVESNFKRFALSSAGAEGLMQIMPFWRHEIGAPGDNLFNRATNLRYGCAILAYYLKLEHGDVTRALARYNGSLGQLWYPLRVESALSQNWQIP
ncbi:lytic transglycosylase catalytic subunit [Salinisphaera hydrothermalis C41B8]|uniref:Lytic transglycosylase catalytic subunit n=1 Tax=Salinisphaera hydrothermalis (strain C41B8) TaxID=1304275 RepID=A0A084IQV5_SALHC|nr:lytic transglycosylase catalytic subunit [Salinisphaera hydrothermalis C41B8]